jgi:hypothetical protein
MPRNRRQNVSPQRSEAFRAQHRVEQIHGCENGQHERQDSHKSPIRTIGPQVVTRRYTWSQRSISANIAAKTASASTTMPTVSITPPTRLPACCQSTTRARPAPCPDARAVSRTSAPGKNPRFEVVEVLGLLNAVRQHVEHRHLVGERQAGADAGVVERKEVEQKRARKRLIVLGVVRLVSKVRREFSEVDLEAASHREDIRSKGLPDVAIHVRTRLVGGTALDRFGRLAELEIEPRAKAAAGIHLRRGVDHDGRLLNAEGVRASGTASAQPSDAIRSERERPDMPFIVGVPSVRSALKRH